MCSKTKYKVLGFSVGASAPASVQIPQCAIEWAQSIDQGLTHLATDEFDFVLLSWQGTESERSAVAKIREICDRNVFPLILAARCDQPGLCVLLGEECFDGFVDLAWPHELAIAAVESSLHRFQLGPKIVDVQREVLANVQQEFGCRYDPGSRDDLTRLYNLRNFREVIVREHARSERHQSPYAIVYFDLDGLKSISAQHGEAASGHVLGQIGEVVAEMTRASDCAFRLGGDEFASLLVDTTKSQARYYAERLCDRIRGARILLGDATIKITASCGIASYPEDGETPKQVMEHADQAARQARNAGMDRVVCYGE
jgi:diguanylate cyclase (GGDEF)-like protein